MRHVLGQNTLCVDSQTSNSKEARYYLGKTFKYPPRSQKVHPQVLQGPGTNQSPLTKFALVATTWASVKDSVLAQLGISPSIIEELTLTCTETEKAIEEPVAGMGLLASSVRYLIASFIDQVAVRLVVRIIRQSCHLELMLNRIVFEDNQVVVITSQVEDFGDHFIIPLAND